MFHVSGTKRKQTYQNDIALWAANRAKLVDLQSEKFRILLQL